MNVAGSPTIVSSPELLATNTIKISNGTKSTPISSAIGAINGARSMTVVALGKTAQRRSNLDNSQQEIFAFSFRQKHHLSCQVVEYFGRFKRPYHNHNSEK